MSAKGILRMVERWQREDVNLHGFEVSHRGQVVAEGYYAPFTKGQMHRMYSVSKTMVMLAILLLVQDGKLGLDNRIADHFPDKLPQNPDPRLMRLTIRNMLRMATCYRETTYDKNGSEPWADSFFTAKSTHESGTLFHYDTSCSQVLGALVERLSGEGLLGFLQRRVFDVCGAMDEKRWLPDPGGIPQGGTGLMMSLRDLGKITRMLAEGGMGVFDKDLLRQATSCQIPTPLQAHPEERFGYGWQLWMTRSGWAMYGMGGQMAIVCPEEELILCTIADTRLDPSGVQRLYDAMYDELIPTLNDTDTAEDTARLQQKLSSLKVPALPHTGHACFTGAWRMEGKGLRAVSLNEKAVTLSWDDGDVTLKWNDLGECCEQVFAPTGEPCIVSAGMAGENDLRVRLNVIGDRPGGFELYLSRAGEHISLRMRGVSDPVLDRFSGLFVSA